MITLSEERMRFVLQSQTLPHGASDFRNTDINRIRAAVSSKMDLDREIGDEEVRDIISSEILVSYENSNASIAEKKLLADMVFNSMRRLDILQPLIDDKSVTEIMVNGPDKIFIERFGRVDRYNASFDTEERLEDVIQAIVSRINRTVNEASPIVDARLGDGSRVNIVLKPVALNGPIMTIRKFPEKPMTMEQLQEMGTLPLEAAAFLEKLVSAKYNIFISGGTGSGKTTFLNALSHYIPHEERVVTIEDSAELQLKQVENLVRMETRNANTEGRGQISMRELIKTSLRMRPERIIVGEVRGAEALDMLQAMNTGHDGSLSTGHANSAADMLSRLETMVLSTSQIPLDAVRKQIASAIDIIIHLSRLRDRSRKVVEICEVTGMEDGEIQLSQLFRFNQEGEAADGRILGKLERTSSRLINTQKLLMAGISCDY